jgi:hypothetical protein
MIASPAILDELVDVLTRPSFARRPDSLSRTSRGSASVSSNSPRPSLGRIATWMPFRRIRRTTLLSRPL